MSFLKKILNKESHINEWQVEASFTRLFEEVNKHLNNKESKIKLGIETENAEIIKYRNYIIIKMGGNDQNKNTKFLDNLAELTKDIIKNNKLNMECKLGYDGKNCGYIEKPEIKINRDYQIKAE